jgi:hypothetical protein
MTSLPQPVIKYVYVIFSKEFVRLRVPKTQQDAFQLNIVTANTLSFKYFFLQVEHSCETGKDAHTTRVVNS